MFANTPCSTQLLHLTYVVPSYRPDCKFYASTVSRSSCNNIIHRNTNGITSSTVLTFLTAYKYFFQFESNLLLPTCACVWVTYNIHGFNVYVYTYNNQRLWSVSITKSHCMSGIFHQISDTSDVSNPLSVLSGSKFKFPLSQYIFLLKPFIVSLSLALMILLGVRIRFSQQRWSSKSILPKIVLRSSADNLIISGSNLTGLLFEPLTLAAADVITQPGLRPLFELISNIVVSYNLGPSKRNTLLLTNIMLGKCPAIKSIKWWDWFVKSLYCFKFQTCVSAWRTL